MSERNPESVRSIRFRLSPLYVLQMIRTLEGGVASLPTTIEMADADLALMYLRHLYRSMTGEQALPAPTS